MKESTKGTILIILAALVIMAITLFATSFTDGSGQYIATVASGLITAFIAWKDFNVSERNIYFQNVLKPLVAKHGLELLQEAVEGMEEMQEDPEDDEELPQ